MKFYVVAYVALKAVILQLVGGGVSASTECGYGWKIVQAHSKAEAEGLVLEFCRETYPPSDGWSDHSANTALPLSEDLIRAAYASLTKEGLEEV